MEGEKYEEVAKEMEAIRQRAMAAGIPFIVCKQKPEPLWAAGVRAGRLYVVQWRLNAFYKKSNGSTGVQVAPDELLDAVEEKTGVKGIYTLMGALGMDKCIGFTLVIDRETKCVGVAMCSAHDEYSKKRGIQMAYGRLRKCPYYIHEDGAHQTWMKRGRPGKSNVPVVFIP